MLLARINHFFVCENIVCLLLSKCVMQMRAFNEVEFRSAIIACFTHAFHLPSIGKKEIFDRNKRRAQKEAIISKNLATKNWLCQFCKVMANFNVSFAIFFLRRLFEITKFSVNNFEWLDDSNSIFCLISLHCHFKCSMGYKFTCLQFIWRQQIAAILMYKVFFVAVASAAAIDSVCVCFFYRIVCKQCKTQSSTRKRKGKPNEPDIISAKSAHKFNSERISLLSIHFPLYLSIHFACPFTWCMCVFCEDDSFSFSSFLLCLVVFVHPECIYY